MYVRPKKALGQHFLKDLKIAKRIADSLDSKFFRDDLNNSRGLVLEIGPGTGVLTQYLLERDEIDLFLSEIDKESIDYLKLNFPIVGDKIIEGDFLKIDISSFFNSSFCVIGNFPYNISSQIFFKLLDYKDNVPQIVCMLQKEVAERLASKPGNKSYGILSVLLQAWYELEYLFTVDEGAFNPPPKVKSGVIRLVRNSRKELGCDYALFKSIIKATFNQRRKTIRNSIKAVANITDCSTHPLMSKRPEQLSVDEFIELTKLIESNS
jgi:16S rRNA (adenine1518-N6/adenine1519-N6)-dimethyltransferase